MNMKKLHNKQSGFTLVEISLAMAVLTLILMLVSMAYISILRSYKASMAARNVQQNNRFIMEQITRVARRSDSVTVTATGLCFDATGDRYFYLEPDTSGDANKNILHQASVADCANTTITYNDHVLTSSGTYVAKWLADTSASTAKVKVLTLSLWVVSRTDLLNSLSPSGLQCDRKVGAEFCAVNKLTTTVELRGDNN